ncbi:MULTISPECIES: hypothetical protein [unclassified Rhizobium]|uniref:hypothetical protein n=1 Tax=unclassified Rhizobium TaxID=2613769 RepID=UPI001ADCF317|nr:MULTISPECIES: hypothetical protein [unclassified Rhizobium]MBO9124922.1 hypothetical protein [Rhizobium sp. 16-488-2b]MBO9175507.1 hypothetical protein [Rhizobium sp. 16-488-2a]
MSDPAADQLAITLDMLEKQILERESELAEWRAFLVEREAEIALGKKRAENLRTMLEEMRQFRPAAKPLSLEKYPTAQPGRPGKQSEQIRQLAKVILREAGKPIMQLDLKERMEAKGLLLQTVNPVDLIRSALRNQPEFRHIRSEGWTLVNPPE